MQIKPGMRNQRTKDRTIIKKIILYSPSFYHLSSPYKPNSIGEMIHIKVMAKQFLFPIIFFRKEANKTLSWNFQSIY